MNTPLQAVGNCIIVKQDDAPTMSEGGLLLADTAQVKPQSGTVISIGKKVRARIKVGDRVSFGQKPDPLFTINHDGVEYLVIFEMTIWGVLTDPAPVHKDTKEEIQALYEKNKELAAQDQMQVDTTGIRGHTYDWKTGKRDE